MYIGIARYDFLVPGSRSLKDKRQVVRAVVGGVRSKFTVAIAEVDHQDLRQRGSLGISCVANSSFHAKKVLHEVEKFVRSQYAIEVLDVASEVVTLDA